MFFLGRIAKYYRDRARSIFHYYDGTKWQRADPVVIGTKLDEVCPKYLDLLATVQMKPSDAPPGPVRDSVVTQRRDAALKLADAARTVFGLVPLSGRVGVTTAECVDVIADYFMFMEGLATEAQLFPVSPGVASPYHPVCPTPPIAASGTAVG